MTENEAVILAQTLGLVIFYAIAGLMPGVAIGLMLGNRLAARDKETLMEKHVTNIRRAEEHNAQADPAHERWQK
jgi:hypothetical protein